MSQNILITGAAGFIGGSVLASLIGQTTGPIKDVRISAAVRSEEQAKALSKLGVNVVKADLKNGPAMKEVVIGNDIDIVLHIAGSIESDMVGALIEGLGERKKATGKDTYFIHGSVSTPFIEEAGWKWGQAKDTDDLYGKQKELKDLQDLHPVRLTNIFVNEQSEIHGVTSLIMAIPHTYGTGTGEWRKLSVNIPAIIRTSIKQRTVHKFDQNGLPLSAHITDLVDLYILMIEHIIRGDKIPSGKQGYYFPVVHRISWWATMDRIASSLYKRGLIDDPEVKTWPSDEMAAQELGFPLLYIRDMTTSSGDLVAVNPYKLGWKPQWDEKKYLESIDDEVQAVLDHDIGQNSLFNSIK